MERRARFAVTGFVMALISIFSLFLVYFLHVLAHYLYDLQIYFLCAPNMDYLYTSLFCISFIAAILAIVFSTKGREYHIFAIPGSLLGAAEVLAVFGSLIFYLVANVCKIIGDLFIIAVLATIVSLAILIWGLIHLATKKTNLEA